MSGGEYGMKKCMEAFKTIGEGSFCFVWPGNNDFATSGDSHIRGNEQLYHLLNGCHFIPAR